MNKFVSAVKKEANYTETENGAVALKSTLNANLDAFGSLGAMMYDDDVTIMHTFCKAFYEDRKTAMRLLFYIRDIRGGQGMRRVFRTIITGLAETEPEYITNNLDNILEFGRADDLLCLLDTSIETRVISWIKTKLDADYVAYTNGEPISLLAKWLPSENASSKQTKSYAWKLINGFNWSPKLYRKTLSVLRQYSNVVETKMSANRWEEINYEAVPSKAGLIYGDAFYKHDGDRYIKYLADLAEGKAKINAGAVFPVDILHKILTTYRYSRKEILLFDAMWKALPDYTSESDETGICVVDTSGSMSGKPMEVALSLGIYLADKCRGPFKNHFITFSRRPELVEIVGNNIVDKVNTCLDVDWGMNTNLEAVFDLILTAAKENNLSENDMPKKLYIISDMQFDEARENYCFERRSARENYYFQTAERKSKPTFMQQMKQKYEEAGYTMPIIVYWNVRASDCGMFQETFEGEQCCMVSGYSPSLFKAIIEGTTYEEVEVKDEDGTIRTEVREEVNPIDVMNAALNSGRYDAVWVG